MDSQVIADLQLTVVKYKQIKVTCLWQGTEWKCLSCKFTDKQKHQWITAVNKYHKENLYRVTEKWVCYFYN
jgi:hypothetical protein